MDKEEREIMTMEFPSNSLAERRQSKNEKIPEGKKIEKVITGNVVKQKRSFGKKMADIFIEDSTKSVGSYIFHDVLIPAAKSMVCDMVGWGGMAEMILFGSVRGARGGRTGGNMGSRTNYNKISYQQGRDQRDDRRDISKTGRAKHDFDEIVLETRGEAEEVRSHLVDLTIDYGMATVADLYDLVGITSNFTDNKYGWYDLRNSSISRVRGGYLINLPRTQLLD